MTNGAHLSCGTLVGDTITVFANCSSANQLWELLSLGSYLLLTGGIDYQEQACRYDLSKDLRNTTIVAAAVDQPSFYYSVKFKSTEESNDTDEFEGGINVEAYRFLRDSLNFREKALKSRGQMNSDENGDLKNEGIAEVLNTGQAHLAISLFEPLPYRVAGPYGVRFLHSVFKSSKAVAVFTQPHKNSVRNVFGLPFQPKVWIGVFFLYVLIILILWLFLTITASHKNLSGSLKESLRQIHFWMLCILTRQGFIDKTSHVTCLRLVLLAGFICSVILYSLYTSALTSIFAGSYEPILLFSQLVNKKYTLYYDKYVPVIKSILKDYRGSNITVVEMGHDVEDIMRKAGPEIFDSKSALLTSQDRVYPFFHGKYHDSFLCNKLSEVPLAFVSTSNANFVKQGSPYRDIFNIKFLLMQQSGLILRFYKEHDLKTTLTCLPTYEPEFLTLDIYDAAFPFLILFYMALLSVLILAGEVSVMNHSMNMIYRILCRARYGDSRSTLYRRKPKNPNLIEYLR